MYNIKQPWHTGGPAQIRPVDGDRKCKYDRMVNLGPGVLNVGCKRVPETAAAHVCRHRTQHECKMPSNHRFLTLNEWNRSKVCTESYNLCFDVITDNNTSYYSVTGGECSGRKYNNFNPRAFSSQDTCVWCPTLLQDRWGDTTKCCSIEILYSILAIIINYNLSIATD